MTTMKITFFTSMLALTTAGFLIGCEPDKAPTAPPPPQPTAAEVSSALPDDLFLDKAPEGAVELAAAKKSAKPGDQVVVRGRIAGQVDPLAPNRAILTLLDGAVTTCDEMPGDSCATPWDACCEPRESLQANTATIQVVDAAGKPLKTGLRGVNGIEPLKELVVVGQVHDASDANALVIDAKGIYVKG
ncbi:MAG TPA: hypothetical protein VGR35_19535 [Tepidisphaeraceae bacterium]|nr:hypothetical protein [Tepidisphaeraceae bacterium]